MKKNLIVLFWVLSIAFLLRVYKLNTLPIGLYSDETSIGYNAFSLLKTGADEFGNKFPFTFVSFGDYKPPMSVWLDVPSVYLLGLNNFSVRLPSAISGLITILIVYLIAKEIFEKDINRNRILKYLPELAAFSLAISPWHILMTRSNMLVGEELMFTAAGFLFFLKGFKNNVYFFLSSISFSLAIYTYYGARITIFALLFILTLIYKREVYIKKKSLILPILIAIIILSPLIYSIFKNPYTLTGRAKTISIFYDQHINLKLWQAHTQDGSEYPVLLSRFFNNKPYLYLNDIVKRYLQHYTFDFLVLKGDTQIPFNMEKMGVVYLPSFIFFFIGMFYLLRYKKKESLALISYLAVSPIAASFTFMTPAANRSFNMVIPFSILSSVGILISIEYLSKYFSKRTAIVFIAISYSIYFAFFIHTYFFTIPNFYPQLWHYGRQELITKVSKVQNNFDKVIVSDSQGPAYIWFLFYQKYDPLSFRNSYKVNSVPDNFGFINITSFSKYIFIKPFDWATVEKNPRYLYIGFEQNIPDNWEGFQKEKHYSSEVIDKVLYPNGSTAFKLVKIN